MESLKRFTSVRRNRPTATGPTSPVEVTAAPEPQPQFEELLPPPRIVVYRRDSVLVDPSDPAGAAAAALASAATEAVVKLVRRAKSTREAKRPRRTPSTAVARERDRPHSFDVATRPSFPQQQPAQVDAKSSDAQPTAGLKKRPSLRQRWKSKMSKPAVIPPSVVEEPPVDSQFVYRPKRAAADFSHLAASLQVPRDSTDGPASPLLPRPSFDPGAGADVLSKRSPDLSRDAPEPFPQLQAPPAEGQCRRCGSTKLPRGQSSVRRPPLTADPSSPRSQNSDSKTPTATQFRSNSTRRPSTSPRAVADPSAAPAAKDPFSDYHLLVSRAEGGDQQEGVTTGVAVSVPIFTLAGPTASSGEERTSADVSATTTNTTTTTTAVDSTNGEDSSLLRPVSGELLRRGHVKQAPSWASYGGGDSDAEKVQEHRKSQMYPAAATEPPEEAAQFDAEKAVEQYPLPPRTLRRQRSVAQRIVDYIRPMSRRSASKPPVSMRAVI